MTRRTQRTRLRAWMAVCGILLAAACTYALGVGTRYFPASWHPASAAAVAAAARPPLLPARYVGVAPPGFPHSEADLLEFSQVTRVHPNIVSWYYGWGPPFDTKAAEQIEAFGSLPFLNLDSDTVPVAAIADGQYDGYLASYAAAIRAFGHPIALSFDHEVNGDWFPWGYQRTGAAVFIAAWRHIHDIFAAAGASNVIWVWMIASDLPGTAALKAFYPGNAYVNWVGLDGYYTSPAITFASVFGADLTQVKRFSDRPALITETGVEPGTWRAAAITDLFRNAANMPGLIGLVWFDFDKGPSHEWRIDSDPAAVNAFRRGAAGYELQAGPSR